MHLYVRYCYHNMMLRRITFDFNSLPLLKRMASQRTNIPTIKQCPDLTNYIIIITVYRENNMKFVNIICGQKEEYLALQ
jgi:hypothetical protein